MRSGVGSATFVARIGQGFMNPERWKQVSQLFHAALARDAGERAAFLTGECAGDHELRLIVESLISQESATGSSSMSRVRDAAKPDPEGSANDPAASADTVNVGVQRAPGSTSPMEGRRLGAYRITREIGHGGMGSVYLAARADDVFHKEVAIKIVRMGLANADLLRRFHQEREILASLDHPAIARIIDGGSTEEGLPYLVMDYVDGRPIDAWCDEHRLNVSERLTLFRAVCAAVQHAHQRLVLHRDIKPAHILVTLNGDVKLLDFGIAKLFADDGLARTLPETETATRIMTPEYASPEQVRGDAVHTASDVYALGVVLYELLTGRWPYGTRGRLLYDVIRAICDEEPTRPSIAVSQMEEAPRAIVAEGSVDALRRRLEGDLDNILVEGSPEGPVPPVHLSRAIQRGHSETSGRVSSQRAEGHRGVPGAHVRPSTPNRRCHCCHHPHVALVEHAHDILGSAGAESSLDTGACFFQLRLFWSASAASSTLRRRGSGDSQEPCVEGWSSRFC